MKLPGIALAVAVGWFCARSAAAADVTAPIDYTRRNEAFAPAPSVAPDIRRPVERRTLEDTPRSFPVSSPSPGPLGDRRAPISVTETSPKSVAVSDPLHPDASAPTMSALEYRRAPILPGTHAVKPPLVEKYQAALSPRGAIRVVRLPALAPDATAAIDRFVFRHNQPVPASATATAAASGAAR
jgi:hypothetical protein